MASSTVSEASTNHYRQHQSNEGATLAQDTSPLLSARDDSTRTSKELSGNSTFEALNGTRVGHSHPWQSNRRLRLPTLPRRLTAHPRKIISLVVLLAALATIAYVQQREHNLSLPWIPDKSSLQFAERPLPPPLGENLISNYTLPLRTKGKRVIDAHGNRFKLHSVNWYGASDELFVVGGLDVQHRNVIAQTIKRLGFNSVRLPYADELVTANPVVESHRVAANPDLVGLRALDVFEAAVSALTDAGLAVIVNNHITSATWCCGANPCDSGWSNDHLGGICRVSQSEDDWIKNWETVMERFVHNPYVIGADLRNEVRGLWGTMPWSKWAAAAERCGNRLLDMKNDWLIIVEGTESANDVSGAAKRPVQLNSANKLVYSAHVYRWSGWGSAGGRFGQRTYYSFVETMHHNWAYLLKQDIAPVWVAEVGAPKHPSIASHRYWSNLWRLLKSLDADFGYWAINPRTPKDNATESYSLVEDDWITPVLDFRMKDMQELMRA